MRPKQDVYSLDTDNSPAVYSLDAARGFEHAFLEGDDLPSEPVAVKETPCVPGRDDRKSCRNPVPEARQSCELKLGDDVLPALLLDESRGGFAILADRLEGAKPGKKAKLHTDMGWFQVRIVYVREAARPAHANTKSDRWFRLGLRKKRSFFLF
jgi:hypothetical protein